MPLEMQIKDFALELGFCKCGITSAEKLERGLDEAISRGGYEFFLENFKRGVNPQELYPEGKSIIILAYDYVQYSFPQKLLPMIGRAYLSRSYFPQPGSEVYKMLRSFENFLVEKGISFQSDMNTLLLRPAAERAGVASFGRNNFAYVDGVGSFVMLYGYMVNRELAADEPSSSCKCPPNCRACINVCPTKALYAPFMLDPTKCIGFNNWARVEARQNEVVPREIRAQMGSHVHGCDRCQEICPRNRAKLQKAGSCPKDPLLERIAEEFSLEKLLHMPQGFYEQCVAPILYHYIKDVKYFQRNAAVAIGNSKEKKYIPALKKELTNPNEVIRIHVAWALGEMGAEEAEQALRQHMEVETSQRVLEEMKIALARIKSGRSAQPSR